MMMSLALSSVVLSSSGGLLSGYQSQHVRLLDTAQTVEAAPVGQSAEAGRVTLEQLRTERAQLARMPRFTGPAILLAVGLPLAGAATFGLAQLKPSDFDGPFRGLGFIAAALLLIPLLAGVAMAITGGILLTVVADRRERATLEIERLDAQIRQLEAGGGHDEPLPSAPTPPPLPPLSSRFLPAQGL